MLYFSLLKSDSSRIQNDCRMKLEWVTKEKKCIFLHSNFLFPLDFLQDFWEIILNKVYFSIKLENILNSYFIQMRLNGNNCWIIDKSRGEFREKLFRRFIFFDLPSLLLMFTLFPTSILQFSMVDLMLYVIISLIILHRSYKTQYSC